MNTKCTDFIEYEVDVERLLIMILECRKNGAFKSQKLERIIKAKSTKMMMEYANIGKGIDVSIKKKKMNDIEKGDWAEKILRAKTIKDLTYSN